MLRPLSCFLFFASILLSTLPVQARTIQIWYRAGSRNEISGKTGLAHLTEHMMFKGTVKYGKGEFSRRIARNGGTENAFTGKDYTAYFENLSSNKVGLALELESDRMKNLVLSRKEFKLEREVVKEERRLRTEDDPQSLVVEQLYATAFLVHPYRSPIIGWMSNLNNLRRNDVTGFYKRFYAPNHATLVIVGDIQPKKLLAKIRQTFGKVPKGFPAPALNIKEPEQRGERRFVIKKEAQLSFVMAGYRVPNYSHPDHYALIVLANILSSGKSSRLYRGLVYEKGLALDAGGYYPGLSANPDLFYIYGIPQKDQTPEALEEALHEEIKRLRTKPVTARELQKAKNQIAAEAIMARDSNFYQAMQLGMAETVGAGYAYQESYVDKIQKISRKDVLRAARTHLTSDRRTVGILLPQPRGKE